MIASAVMLLWRACTTRRHRRGGDRGARGFPRDFFAFPWFPSLAPANYGKTDGYSLHSYSPPTRGSNDNDIVIKNRTKIEWMSTIYQNKIITNCIVFRTQVCANGTTRRVCVCARACVRVRACKPCGGGGGDGQGRQKSTATGKTTKQRKTNKQQQQWRHTRTRPTRRSRLLHSLSPRRFYNNYCCCRTATINDDHAATRRLFGTCRGGRDNIASENPFDWPQLRDDGTATDDTRITRRRRDGRRSFGSWRTVGHGDRGVVNGKHFSWKSHADNNTKYNKNDNNNNNNNSCIRKYSKKHAYS